MVKLTTIPSVLMHIANYAWVVYKLGESSTTWPKNKPRTVTLYGPHVKNFY